MFKYFALALDYFLILCYILATHSFNWTVWWILLPPLFHTLTFIVKPHCFRSHCKPIHPKAALSSQRLNRGIDPSSPQLKKHLMEDSSPSPSPFDLQADKKDHSHSQQESGKKYRQKRIIPQYQYEPCQQCGLVKWVRMHHCYYCNICVHKYDHHCVLLGLCIGEANQKFYLPFLWTFLTSSVFQAYVYYNLVGKYLWLDEKGYEHTEWPYTGMSLAIIFFTISIVIVGYLAVYHTYLGLLNDTTYEMRKRPEVYYFSGIIKDHPFDQGILNNLKMMLTASPEKPIEWERPEKPIIKGLQEFEGKNIFDHRENESPPFSPLREAKLNF